MRCPAGLTCFPCRCRSSSPNGISAQAGAHSKSGSGARLHTERSARELLKTVTLITLSSSRTESNRDGRWIFWSSVRSSRTTCPINVTIKDHRSQQALSSNRYILGAKAGTGVPEGDLVAHRRIERKMLAEARGFDCSPPGHIRWYLFRFVPWYLFRFELYNDSQYVQ